MPPSMSMSKKHTHLFIYNCESRKQLNIISTKFFFCLLLISVNDSDTVCGVYVSHINKKLKKKKKKTVRNDLIQTQIESDKFGLNFTQTLSHPKIVAWLLNLTESAIINDPKLVRWEKPPFFFPNFVLCLFFWEIWINVTVFILR